MNSSEMSSECSSTSASSTENKCIKYVFWSIYHNIHTCLELWCRFWANIVRVET
jgi:hypothetical protein